MPAVTITRKTICGLQSDLSAADQKLKELQREEDRRKAKEDAEYRAQIANKANELRAALTVILDVFPLLQEAENVWRREVFRGQAPAEQEDPAFTAAYALWHAIALRRPKIEERAEYFRRHGSTEDLAPLLDRLVKMGEEAKTILQNWETPLVSSSPSLRTATLSAEASARLLDILGSGK
jgi:hypothetical protein